MSTSPINIFGNHPALDSSPLSDRFRAHNKVHSALKHISMRYFHLEMLTFDSVLLNTRTIRLYVDYNFALCTGDSIPEFAPACYLSSSEAMNTHDNSGYGWAFLRDGLIVWDDKMTLANPDSSCVLNHETMERLLGHDKVAVTQCYYENTERLSFLEQQCETKYWKLRQEKKALVKDTIPDIHSKDTKAVFAKKHKTLEDATAAATPSSKKLKKNGGQKATEDTEMT